MSLPNELLDQLLSGYLDDTLTADERVRVEQLLESNAEVVAQFEKLQALRHSLRAVSKLDSRIKLDKGFADRVLDAAVARAREEGLPKDHPLVRLSEQPSIAPSPLKTAPSPWPVAAAMIGLAASIVLAVFVLRSAQGPPAGPDALAQSVVEPAQDEDRPGDIEEVPIPESDSDSMLVDGASPAVQDLAGDDSSSSRSEAAQIDPPTRTANPEVVARDASIASESIAASKTDPDSSTDPPTNQTIPGAVPPIGAIVVVEVTRSEAGRINKAFETAMREAEIAPASRKELTKPITGFVAEHVDGQLDDASVIYLQLPGKQFDLLYHQLWTDEIGIESVRMTLAMNAPLLQVVDTMRPDPTTVRHDAAAYELFSQKGYVNQLATELSRLPFPEVDRTQVVPSMHSSGSDIQTQVLLLVR